MHAQSEEKGDNKKPMLLRKIHRAWDTEGVPGST
jgi:hypothetical protein